MKLTEFERQSLINQYEILKGLHPDREDQYDVLIRCSTDGYFTDFAVQAGHMEPELSNKIRTEMRQILDMFRALTPKGGAPSHLKFGGFDGNEEPAHFAYASFLLEDLDLWKESQDSELNSHTNMLPAYRRMLSVWHTWADKWNPTAELESIMAVAPYLCKPQ